MASLATQSILGGRNQGAVINVGDIVGGTGANAGNINVVIDGGSLSAMTTARRPSQMP